MANPLRTVIAVLDERGDRLREMLIFSGSLSDHNQRLRRDLCRVCMVMAGVCESALRRAQKHSADEAQHY